MTGLTLLFGGSFDPVHRGHVETARASQHLTGACQIIWLPTPRSPLKARTGATPEQRAELLRLALADAGEPSWLLDTEELRLPPPTYSIDTLRRWRARLGADRPLAFLMGRDSLAGLSAWRDWRRLCEYAHLVVASRPGHDAALPTEIENWAENRRISRAELLQSRPFGSLLLLDTPPWPVSSTDLRTALADGRQTSDWLAPAVRDYIDHHGLYLEQGHDQESHASP